MESIKLSNSGKKNNIKVLLNRPRMPLTAKVMPARYVNESPTNTCEGYLRMSGDINSRYYAFIDSLCVPVEVQECQNACQKWEHDVEREQVTIAISTAEFNQIMNDNRHCDHGGLTRFKAIDARVNVDAVRAEHGNQ